MTAEYIAKIKGDTSQLEEVLKKVQGKMSKLNDDEVLIKLNYDGNVKQFNKVFDQIVKSCPELTIQFQYEVNNKLLNSELEKLQNMTNLEFDINTSNVGKKIKSMVKELDDSISSGATENDIRRKVEDIYKYANTAKSAGAHIGSEFAEEIHKSLLGTDYEKIFEKISNESEKYKLFEISGSLTEEIQKTKSSIDDFKKYMSDLEEKGASPLGQSGNLKQLHDDVKIIKADISELKELLNSVSADKFNDLIDKIQVLNDKLDDTISKIKEIQNLDNFEASNISKKENTVKSSNKDSLGIDEDKVRELQSIIREIAYETDKISQSSLKARGNNLYKTLNDSTKEYLISLGYVDKELDKINYDIVANKLKTTEWKKGILEFVEEVKNNDTSIELAMGLVNGVKSTDIIKGNNSSVDMSGKYNQVIHSHPFDLNRNNLRFAADDLLNFVKEDVKNLYLLCGEEMLDIDISSIPKESLNEFKQTAVDQIIDVYLRYGAELDDNGKLTGENINKIPDELYNKATDVINQMLLTTVESYGGKLSHYTINNNELINTSDRIKNTLTDDDKTKLSLIHISREQGNKDAIKYLQKEFGVLKEEAEKIDESRQKSEEKRHETAMQNIEQESKKQEQVEAKSTRRKKNLAAFLAFQEPEEEKPVSKETKIAQDNIESVKKTISDLYSFINKYDEKGVISKYLFDDNGKIKSGTQLVSEINSEFETVAKKFSDDYTEKGIVRSAEEYMEALEETFRKIRTSLFDGLIDNNDIPEMFRNMYNTWSHQENHWIEQFESMGDDIAPAYGKIYRAQELLDRLQKNDSKEYIEFLEKEFQLKKDISDFEEKSKKYSKPNFDNYTLNENESKAKSFEIKNEISDLDKLIEKLKELDSEENKNLNNAEIDNIAPIHLISMRIKELEELRNKLQDIVDDYENASIILKRKQVSIFDKGIDDKTRLSTKAKAPKELEDYYDHLIDEILKNDGSIDAYKAIQLFNDKAEELGVTFDEDKGKWISLSSAISDDTDIDELVSDSEQADSHIEELGEELKEVGQEGQSSTSHIVEGLQEVQDTAQKAAESIESIGEEIPTTEVEKTVETIGEVVEQEVKQTITNVKDQVDNFVKELDNREYGKGKNIPKTQRDEYVKAKYNISDYIRNWGSDGPVVFTSGFGGAAKDPEKYIHTIAKLNSYQKLLRSDAKGIATDLSLGVITEEQAEKELLVLKSIDETIQRRRELLNEYKNVASENVIDGTPDLFESQSGQLSFIEELTDAEQKASDKATELANNLGKVAQETQIPGQMSFDDMNQAAHAEEKLLPMVIDTQHFFERQNEELERRNAIERAFLQTIGQDRESIQTREAIALIKEKREEQEKLNQAKKEEVTAPPSSTVENVDIKAEKSTEELHKEAKGMTEVKEESEKASTSKKDFAKANAEVLQSIKDSLSGLGDETEFFKALNNVINKFSGKGSDERISKLANNIIQVRDALSGSIDDSSFISALQKLAEQGESLKDLAEVLKASKKQIENTSDYISDREEKAAKKEEADFEKLQYSLAQKAKSVADNMSKQIIEGTGKYHQNLIEQWKTLQEQATAFKLPADSAKVAQAIQDVDKLDKKLKELTSDSIKKDNKLIQGDSLEKLYNRIQDFKAKNTNLGKDLARQLDEVIDRVDKLFSARNLGNGLETELKEISQQFIRIQGEANKAGEAGKSFGHKIIDSLTNANARFIANYMSLQDMIRYAREFATTVRDIDSALTELRKVSDASSSRLQQNFENSAKTAKELGSSITDVINQTADWARLGYNVDDAEELARVTTLFQTVGDNMTAETASETMISTIKAYGIAVDDSERIVDQYNEIANNFAIDTAGLSESITRAGAALHAAGNELSESMALVVAANDSLQDPSSVGQMLKTKHCLYAQ